MYLPAFAYAEFPPGTAVQDLVVSYWRLTVPAAAPVAPPRVELRPDGCVHVAVALCAGCPTAVPLVGPRRTACPLDVPPGTQLWGVRFRPEMGPAALGRPALSLRDVVGPAHHWFGVEPITRLERAVADALAPYAPPADSGDATAAVALAFDRWLFDAADHTLPPDGAIREAVRAIVATEGRQSIATIAEWIGLSIRHLQRGFKDAVGLSPKEYAMVCRERCATARDAARMAWEVERLTAGMSDAVRRRMVG
jgi:AraC-like DNA-binding protein